MRVVLYARTGTDCDEDLERQIRVMTGFSEACSWEICQTYSDCAPATDMAHRPAWRQMLQDASNGRFDVLLMRSIDRGFRSAEDAAATTGRLRRIGVILFWLSGPYSADDTGDWFVAEGLVVCPLGKGEY